MAWTEPTYALLLREAARYDMFSDTWAYTFSDWANVTSTSTVRLGALRSRVYMYGIQGSSIETSAREAMPPGDSRVWVASNQADPTSCNAAFTYLGYLVSAARTDDYAFEITLPAYGADPAALATYRTDPISTTCIRDAKREYWSMLMVTGYGGATLTTAVDPPTDWDFRYKDPCVVELPDRQGWVMFLIRVATRVVDLPTGPKAPPPGEVGKSLFSVVAYWSPSPSFAGPNLSGPHLVVSDLAALPAEPGRNQNFRVSLGVPGAAILTTEGAPWLYLYYTTARNTYQDGASESDPYFDEAFGYQTAAQDYGDPYEAHAFHQGITCKRFQVSKLVTALREEPADEATWEPSSALEGELLGLVRFWFAAGERYDWSSGAPKREPAAHRFHVPWTSEATPFEDFGKLVDPAPVACGSNLVLFNAVIDKPSSSSSPPPLREQDGHGIWRSTSTAEIERLYDLEGNAWRDLRLGRDFIVRAEDRLLVSEGTNVYIDPDPCLLSGGSIRVFTNNKGLPALVYIDGTHEDLCVDLDDYWDLPEESLFDPIPGIDITPPELIPPHVQHFVHPFWSQAIWPSEPMPAVLGSDRRRARRGRVEGVHLSPYWSLRVSR